MSYYVPFITPPDTMSRWVTEQTIPTSRKTTEHFVGELARNIGLLAEVMVAFAKLPPPQFSITIAAGTPFDAYLLLSRVIKAATEYVFIADNYLDASIFYRYLHLVAPSVKVSLRTNPLL